MGYAIHTTYMWVPTLIHKNLLYPRCTKEILILAELKGAKREIRPQPEGAMLYVAHYKVNKRLTPESQTWSYNKAFLVGTCVLSRLGDGGIVAAISAETRMSSNLKHDQSSSQWFKHITVEGGGFVWLCNHYSTDPKNRVQLTLITHIIKVIFREREEGGGVKIKNNTKQKKILKLPLLAKYLRNRRVMKTTGPGQRANCFYQTKYPLMRMVLTLGIRTRKTGGICLPGAATVKLSLRYGAPRVNRNPAYENAEALNQRVSWPPYCSPLKHTVESGSRANAKSTNTHAFSILMIRVEPHSRSKRR